MLKNADALGSNEEILNDKLEDAFRRDAIDV